MKENETKMNPNQPDFTTGQLLSSRIKFRIFHLFEIYQKLTLQEIADKLSRSKSSIHPHVHKLIEMGYLKQPNKVDENRSYIFERSDKQLGFNRGFDFSSGLTPQFISQMVQVKVDICEAEKMLIDESIHFWKLLEKLNQDPANTEELKELIQDINDYDLDMNGHFKLNEKGKPSLFSKTSTVISYFDENTFREFRQEFNILMAKYHTIMAEQGTQPKRHSPILVYTKIIPLEKFVEYNNRKSIK